VETAHIDYPTAVIDCHAKALQLALTRPYQNKQPKDLPELSAGLAQIAKIAQAARAVTAEETPPLVPEDTAAQTTVPAPETP
jgi:hypothetical protein